MVEEILCVRNLLFPVIIDYFKFVQAGVKKNFSFKKGRKYKKFVIYMKKLFSLRFLWLIFLDEGGGFFQESIRNFFFNHEKLFFMGKYNKFLFRQKIGSFKRAQKKKKMFKKSFFRWWRKVHEIFSLRGKIFLLGDFFGWVVHVGPI